MSLCAKYLNTRGSTLVEMLVVLVVVSLLAAAAIPGIKRAAVRGEEFALRESLRQTRSAIDAFHQDWKSGVIERSGQGISTDGYPADLSVLIDGVADSDGNQRRYLRAMPDNPFEAEDDWLLLGYRDSPDAQRWNGQDVYDLKANTERTALDGTQISDW